MPHQPEQEKMQPASKPNLSASVANTDAPTANITSKEPVLTNKGVLLVILKHQILQVKQVKYVSKNQSNI